LQNRIRQDLQRLVSPLEGANFEYGFNSNYLKDIGKYWLDSYDWRREEARLNSLPHFKTSIDGLDLHFIHVRPNLDEVKEKTVIPLLMVHGWPGSVAEFYKILPMLTHSDDEQDFVFEVIAPSIPGRQLLQSPDLQCVLQLL